LISIENYSFIGNRIMKIRHLLVAFALVGIALVANLGSVEASPYKVFSAPKDLLEDMKPITSSFKKGKPIVMFQSPTCHFCDVARDDLQGLGIEIKEIDVTKLVSAPYWGRVVEVTGIAGTPQFLVGDKLFLGYSREKILKELKSE